MSKWIFWALSIGLILFPVHNKNQPLFEYGVFAPHIGIALITISVYLILKKYKWEWGNKYVTIPVLIIIASMWARLIVSFDMRTFAGACMGTILAGLYFAVMKVGRNALVAFLPALIVQCVSVLMQAFLHPAGYAGGWVTTYVLPGLGTPNYDIAIGVMIFGLLLCDQSYYWWLSLLVIPATILTGAGEGLISLGILGLFGIARRDFGRKLIPLIAVLAIFFTVGIATGVLPKLYNWGIITVTTISDPTGFETRPEREMGEQAFWGRVRVWRESLSRLAPLGHGYEVVAFTGDTVHNVPLVVVDQLGLLAGLAWLWMSLYCLIKTKYKYLWVGILSLSIFDHFIWTQLAPWWWLAVGLSTAYPKDNDLVFRQHGELPVV